jgi:DNA-binding Lrp family transcriptional regulator
MLDKNKQEILLALMENANRDMKQIGDELGLNSDEVKNIVDFLHESGVIIKKVPVINPDFYKKCANKRLRIVKIRSTAYPKIKEILEEKWPGITVYAIYGESDVICKFFANDDEVDELISDIKSTIVEENVYTVDKIYKYHHALPKTIDTKSCRIMDELDNINKLLLENYEKDVSNEKIDNLIKENALLGFTVLHSDVKSGFIKVLMGFSFVHVSAQMLKDFINSGIIKNSEINKFISGVYRGHGFGFSPDILVEIEAPNFYDIIHIIDQIHNNSLVALNIKSESFIVAKTLNENIDSLEEKKDDDQEEIGDLANIFGNKIRQSINILNPTAVKTFTDLSPIRKENIISKYIQLNSTSLEEIPDNIKQAIKQSIIHFTNSMCLESKSLLRDSVLTISDEIETISWNTLVGRAIDKASFDWKYWLNENLKVYDSNKVTLGLTYELVLLYNNKFKDNKILTDYHINILARIKDMRNRYAHKSRNLENINFPMLEKEVYMVLLDSIEFLIEYFYYQSNTSDKYISDGLDKNIENTFKILSKISELERKVDKIPDKTATVILEDFAKHVYSDTRETRKIIENEYQELTALIEKFKEMEEIFEALTEMEDKNKLRVELKLIPPTLNLIKDVDLGDAKDIIEKYVNKIMGKLKAILKRS